MMIVVSDTSSLSNLLVIERLDLLRQIFGEVLIPNAVAKEFAVLDRNRRELLTQEWISIVDVTDKQLLSSVRIGIDSGEAEAITLSIELSADFLLIDELAGRRRAREHGLSVIGVAGILVEAKRLGFIDLVRPEIERLRDEARFHMSSGLIEEVLDSVNEL